MLKNLIGTTLRTKPVGWRFLEELGDQVAELLRVRAFHRRGPIRQLILVLDPLLNLVSTPVVEGTLPNEKLEEENADSPPVDCLVVLAGVQHLGSLVLGSADERVSQRVCVQRA